jgi:hypothetical protein
MGGTSDPAINEPSNLVMLCDACHLRGVEIYRLQAYRDGFLLYASGDPAREPVKIYARGFVHLTRDGQYSPTPPED